MKKIGILLAILLVAGVCAMADEAVPAQDDLLFADIDAVVLSQAEMEVVDGGQRPDMDGSTSLFSRYSRNEVKNSDYVPTQKQAKESAKLAKKLALHAVDGIMIGVGTFGGPVGTGIAFAYGSGRWISSLADF
jgi:hypothetical protein